MLAALLGFAAFAAVLTITPGLDTLVVVRTAAVSGKVAAFAAALGVGLGCLAWAVASGLGLTALLTASEVAYGIVRWAGAAYLFFLGIRGVRAALRRRGADLPEIGVPVRSPGAAFRVGLFTNLLNPKVGIFYLAALPQFLPKDTSALLASVALGLVHDLEGLIWFALLIFVVSRAAAWLTKASVQRRLEALSGVVFIGFGVKLALAKTSS